MIFSLYLWLYICRVTKSLVHIVVLKYVDGQSHSLEAEVVAISIHFMV